VSSEKSFPALEFRCARRNCSSPVRSTAGATRNPDNKNIFSLSLSPSSPSSPSSSSSPSPSSSSASFLSLSRRPLCNTKPSSTPAKPLYRFFLLALALPHFGMYARLYGRTRWSGRSQFVFPTFATSSCGEIQGSGSWKDLHVRGEIKLDQFSLPELGARAPIVIPVIVRGDPPSSMDFAVSLRLLRVRLTPACGEVKGPTTPMKDSNAGLQWMTPMERFLFRRNDIVSRAAEAFRKPRALRKFYRCRIRC
jgi:hypothetical protein